MFIIQKKNNKKILVNKNSLKHPKLIKIEKIKDEAGNTENIYHYDIYIDVDKRHAIEKNLQTIEIEKIDNNFQKINTREKIFDNINTNNPKSINIVANNALKIKLDQTINKKANNGIEKIGSVSVDTVFNSQNISKLKSKILENKSESKIFGTVKRLTLIQQNKKNTNKKNLLNIPKKNKLKKIVDTTENFQSKYNKILNAGIDPSVRISKIIKNNRSQGLLNRRKGRFTSLSYQKEQDGVYSYFNNTIKNANNRQQSNSLKNNNSLQFIEKSARISTITQRISISESQLLKNPSNEINLTVTVKDAKGVGIETIPIVIHHKKEKESLKFPKFNFEIEANKTSSGQVTLKIINNENFSRSFNVYSRQLNEYLPQEQINYKLKIGDVKIPPKSSLTLFRKGYHFKSNRPVFFRVNALHERKEYANSKFASIETGRRLSAINYAGLSAIIQNERIAIQVKNISANIKKVELYRRDISKKERNFNITKSFNDRLGKSLENNRGKIIKKNSAENIFTFYDDDVEYDHTYEYKALLYDDNGNKMFSSTSAIENYTKAHGIVDMSIEKSLTAVRNDQKILTLTGNVSKKINDADKIFQDLFGRYYDLFEDDLKSIKDLNAITINLLVEMINRDNSDIIRLKEISVDSDGNFTSEIAVPATADIAIKITPRVMPPSEILSKIDNNLPNLAAKNRFAPVSAFNTAAIKRKIQQASRGFVSQMADKHSQRSVRLKGKILDSKTQLNKTNFDAYYDGNTGDVRYILEGNALNRSYQNATITLKNKKIKYLELDSKKNIKLNQKYSNQKKEYFLSSFVANDSLNLIDYFVMSYEENDNTSIEGIAFNMATNENLIIDYLFQTPTLYGKINFYAQPILKNGKIQNPILIKTIYKDDEGIK